MLDQLNPQQREAVLCTDGPLLLIAGAGTGKTRVLTTRIAWLVLEQGVPSHQVLAFTFTNKAAREMRERVARFVPEAASAVWLGTFHATGARILRQHAPALGYPRGFTIYDTDDTRALLREILEEVKADPRTLPPRAAAAAISRLKNGTISPAQAQAMALTPPDRKLADVYALYERRLRACAAMDFDDLIGKTVELLETRAEVLATYAGRFRYVLVDEFQDTNPLQLVLIKALSSVYGNLFAVGDDDQSIYSWRGATIDNMMRFEEYFPGARVMRLERNYRSTAVILQAANHVIAHNRRRRGKNLWCDVPGGELLELWHASGDEEEGQIVLRRLEELLAAGECARKDAVVLYRTNAQSRILEDALRRASVPYQIVGGVRFYERREVRDVLAYCKLIGNSADAVSFARVVNVPRRGIGKTTVDRLEAAARAADVGPLAMLADPGAVAQLCGRRAAARLLEFAALLGRLRALAEEADAAAVLEQLLVETGYRKHLTDDDPATAPERLENVDELLNAAHAFASESDAGLLADFLEQITLLSEVDQLDEAGDQVTLMTMHNAKGLEFPVVFVAGCEEELLPHASSMGDDARLEEERRLFYVALTRAKRRIVLTAARVRRRFGVVEGTLPSRFLAELPGECVIELGEVEAAAPGTLAGACGFERTASAGAGADLFSVDTFRRSQARLRGGRPGGRTGRRAGLGDRTVTGHGFHDHELSQEEVRFAPGMRVRHALLGEGTVELVEGSGELTKLTISFGEAGRKRLLAAYASLSILEAP